MDFDELRRTEAWGRVYPVVRWAPWPLQLLLLAATVRFFLFFAVAHCQLRPTNPDEKRLLECVSCFSLDDARWSWWQVPLSVFRDVGDRERGRELFGQLQAVALLALAHALCRGRWPRAALFGMCALLLNVTAHTPSLGCEHAAASLALLALMAASLGLEALGVCEDRGLGALHVAGLMVFVVLPLGLAPRNYGELQKCATIAILLAVNVVAATDGRTPLPETLPRLRAGRKRRYTVPASAEDSVWTRTRRR